MWNMQILKKLTEVYYEYLQNTFCFTFYMVQCLQHFPFKRMFQAEKPLFCNQFGIISANQHHFVCRIYFSLDFRTDVML